MRRLGGWGAVAALLLLAGCLQTADPPRAEVPRWSPFLVTDAELEAGRFYAFDHPGGTLEATLADGREASFALHAPDDRRLGTHHLSGGDPPPRLTLGPLPVGSHVLHVLSLNGTLGLHASRELRFAPLPTHVERHVLAQEPHGPAPPFPFIPRGTVEEPLAVGLRRPPTLMRLLSDGSYGHLEVVLRDEAGPVLESEWGGPFLDQPFFRSLEEVPSTFHGDRAVGRNLTGKLSAEDLQGVVLLESWSYSRALPHGQDRVHALDAPPRFSYGRLPQAPVAFHVAADAKTLVAWSEGPAKPKQGTAWVLVFDAEDRKVASLPVEPGTYTAMDVRGGGEYVAVLLGGNATLGADASPATLGLRPLDVRGKTFPKDPAGKDGEYAQEEGTAAAEGVLFDVRPARADDRLFLPSPIDCPPGPSLRVLQHGETLGAWGPSWDPARTPVGVLLGDGEASLWHDGFGPSACSRWAAETVAYVR
jgi:hypothetical protein